MTIYEKSPEILGEPSLKLDGDPADDNTKIIANIVSEFTGVTSSKLEYFFKKFGVNYTLDNLSIIGLDQEQENTLKELKELLNIWSEYNEPVQY